MAKGYKGRIQYLVNHGYVVLGLNYRGSSGFGKGFFRADHRRHGREPLWDCVAAKEYLANTGYVNRAAIGIIGASFGGYMSLAFHATHPGMTRALMLFDTGPGFKKDEARAAWNATAHKRAADLDTRGLAALGSSDEVRMSQHRGRL